MKDVQAQRPKHELPIDKVGITKLKYPVKVLDKAQKYQDTVAEVTMWVALPKQFRGTHMSRFVETLEKFRSEIAYDGMEAMLDELLATFSAESAAIEMKFPYFIEKAAPVTCAKSFLEYEAFFNAQIKGKYNFTLGVVVPITALCPCSKEISQFGAHNQRAKLTIAVEFSQFVWLEELVEIAEKAASAQIFTLLKRPDEKFVTEYAFENAKFVEDIVRDAAAELFADSRIEKFIVECESFESIHNHSAFATISGSKDE